MIKNEDFTKPLNLLLAETFGMSEAPGGFFLDSGRDGLFGTIDTIGAETASIALKPENATIASHCAHILFLLRLFEAYEQGQKPEPDWQESWRTRVVDKAAWQTLRAELQTGYETARARLQARDTWDEPPLAATMTLLVHCAYHIGEIRQLLTSITP